MSPLSHRMTAPMIETVVDELFTLSQVSNAALMQGDVARYQDLLSLADDFLLMSPFGGAPTRARDIGPATFERMGRFFRNGDLRLELLGSWVSDDMAVLAVVERSHVEVGGLPAQEWGLRVTLVYRRRGGRWRLAHRHADPLAGGASLSEAADFAARQEVVA